MVVFERAATGHGRYFAVKKLPQARLRQELRLLLSQNVHSAGMKSFLQICSVVSLFFYFLFWLHLLVGLRLYRDL